MKKLTALLLALALAISFLMPCPVCEELKANGTEEEYAQHILEEHDGVDPYGIDWPDED